MDLSGAKKPSNVKASEKYITGLKGSIRSALVAKMQTGSHITKPVRNEAADSTKAAMNRSAIVFFGLFIHPSRLRILPPESAENVGLDKF